MIKSHTKVWFFLFNLESDIFIDLNSKRNMMNRVLKLIIYLLSLYLLCICILNFGFQNKTWNWDTTNTNEIYYPEDFLWGTATAAHQVEGDIPTTIGFGGNLKR